LEKVVFEDYQYLGGGIIRPEITVEDYLVKLLKSRPMNREQMSIITGIPRTTLYDSLVKLIIQEKVEKYTTNLSKRRGRKTVYYRLVDGSE